MSTSQDLFAAVTDPSGREILDPATGEVVGSVHVCAVAELDDAVAAARAAQPEWAGLGHAKRSECLHRAADAVEANAEVLAEVLVDDESGRAELHYVPLGVVGGRSGRGTGP